MYGVKVRSTSRSTSHLCAQHIQLGFFKKKHMLDMFRLRRSHV